MSNQQTIQADIFLIHAPSVYDFRNRDDLLFAYLSDSDSVNVTSIYEMYPLGFHAMKQRLHRHGFHAEIINLASLMLMHPTIDIDRLIGRLEGPVFGLDLHWMAQCHGAIEVAKRIKLIHPEALVIFGGISATYYADELIQYPAVDMVIKGYDTLELLTQLMQNVSRGERHFKHIPNLLYKTKEAGIVSTGFTHKPTENYNNEAVDWSYYQDAQSDLMTTKLIMTLPNSGCAYDCGWCGGSRYAYRNIMGVERTLITKEHHHVTDELQSMSKAANITYIYALQCYSETKARIHAYLDAIKAMRYKSVSFEQYHLTDPETLKKMAESTNAYIMLSPESHDQMISQLAGRGNYTMAEMEAWITQAFDAGIAGVMVWFFIGMPRQTPQSVMETVAYCESLLHKFRGQNIVPLICPMVPFLDPGSRFFEEPKKHGYRIFYRTLAEHRQAMVEPLWYKRLNYETVWMSRKELQDVTYKAVAQLIEFKAGLGFLPSGFAHTALATIAETTRLLDQIERALALDGRLPPDLRAVIQAYNNKILSYSSDQIIPIQRPFGGRWFDDFTVPMSIINELTIPTS